MKFKDYKVKLYCSFEPFEKKSKYNKQDIMYFYYTLRFKNKKVKFVAHAGDLGESFIQFIEHLKQMINDELHCLSYDDVVKVSYISNSSRLDEATSDSSYKATKVKYGRKDIKIC